MTSWTAVKDNCISDTNLETLSDVFTKIVLLSTRFTDLNED